MSTCGTCKHWEENTGWNSMVSAGSYPEPPEVKEKRHQHGRESGICTKIGEGWMWDESEPLPLATCWDGSEYKATLHTHETFGCVLWEPAATVEGDAR